MTRYDFEDWLRHRLSDLPREELDRIAAFYMDAIEARMEDGMTEEEAIYDLGEPEALLEAIRADLPEYAQTTYQPVRQSRQRKYRPFQRQPRCPPCRHFHRRQPHAGLCSACVQVLPVPVGRFRLRPRLAHLASPDHPHRNRRFRLLLHLAGRRRYRSFL